MNRIPHKETVVQTFDDLKIGDTFYVSTYSTREPTYQKIAPHTARVVNSSEEANFGGHEQVSVLITAVDRQAAIRAALNRT